MSFLEIFDTDAPHRILEDYCSRSKPGADKINYQHFKNDFEASLPLIKSRIASQKYKFTRFEVMLKVKKHYKLPRLIFKSTMRDRFVAKLMAEHMQELYKRQGYCPIKTRDSILSQISDAITEPDGADFKYNYFFRLDISNYFDSINRHLLIDQLHQDAFDYNFISLVKKLFYTMDLSMDRPNGTGVPQGISVSSILAERYLKDLDEKYSAPMYGNTIRFFRYVDDIIVLTTDEQVYQQAKQSTIFELQSKYGLSVNPDKISCGRLNVDKTDFLGITIDNRKLTISTAQIARVMKQLNDLFMWYRRVSRTKKHLLHTNKDRAIESLIERLNLLITGYRYTNSLGQPGKYGWLQTSIPPQIDDIEVLRKLDKHVGSLIQTHIRSQDQCALINEKKKSFYIAFLKCKFSNNKDGYILNRERASEKEMYRIVRNLSIVDLKYELSEKYDAKEFETKVGESLRSHFRKSLYIANRELTSDILYW